MVLRKFDLILNMLQGSGPYDRSSLREIFDVGKGEVLLFLLNLSQIFSNRAVLIFMSL